MSGETLGQARDRVLSEKPGPRSLTVDHGIEFKSRAREEWAYRFAVQPDFIMQDHNCGPLAGSIAMTIQRERMAVSLRTATSRQESLRLSTAGIWSLCRFCGPSTHSGSARLTSGYNPRKPCAAMGQPCSTSSRAPRRLFRTQAPFKSEGPVAHMAQGPRRSIPSESLMPLLPST